MPLFQTKNNVLFKVFSQFAIDNKPLYIEPYGNGNIHETFRVCTDGNCFILQKINRKVFKNIDALEHNLTKLKSLDKNNLLTPKVFKSKTDKYFAQYEEDFYRIMEYIPNSNPDESLLLPHERIKNAASGYALFHRKSKDLHPDDLEVVIPSFHDLNHHLELFHEAIKESDEGRLTAAKAAIDQINLLKDRIVNLADMIHCGELSLSVVHNDAKIGNILLDKDSGHFKRVIDLDTIMAGTILYDFGDFCRSSIAVKAESEYSKVKNEVDIYLFEMACEGFTLIKNDLNSKEKSLLFDAISYMTYLMAVRFLTDYLNGDIYFRTESPNENLVRTENQLDLLEDLISNEKLMREIIRSAFRS